MLLARCLLFLARLLLPFLSHLLESLTILSFGEKVVKVEDLSFLSFFVDDHSQRCHLLLRLFQSIQDMIVSLPVGL